MTSYHISIGYCAESKADFAWGVLKLAARSIADDPKKIVAEARRLGAPETCSEGCCQLETFADNYAEPFDDFRDSKHRGAVISIDEGDPKDPDRSPQIIQWACAADSLKLAVRRAFVRLLIEAMHRQKIEVNLTVG